MTAATITVAIDLRSVCEKYAPRIMPRAAANRKAKKQRTLEEHKQAHPLEFHVDCDCTQLASGCERLELVV